MLSHIKPAVAVLQPCGAFGVGIGLPEGIGSVIRPNAKACALPRVRRVWPETAMFSPQSQLAGIGGAANQETSQHNYMTTRTNPVYTGGLGPYPGREPKPV
jgi:hypothetical protein